MSKPTEEKVTPLRDLLDVKCPTCGAEVGNIGRLEFKDGLNVVLLNYHNREGFQSSGPCKTQDIVVGTYPPQKWQLEYIETLKKAPNFAVYQEAFALNTSIARADHEDGEEEPWRYGRAKEELDNRLKSWLEVKS